MGNDSFNGGSLPSTSSRSRRVWRALVAAALAGCGLAPAAGCSSPDTTEPTQKSAAPLAGDGLVISAVFGGGTTSGTFQRDFVEIFNRTNAPISLAGLSVQYSSQGQTFLSTNYIATLPAVDVPAGGYYLVGFGSAADGGTPLPVAVDTSAAASTNLSSNDGKVALVRGTGALNCGVSANKCKGNGNLIDLVGYGTAQDWEGIAAAGGGDASASSTKSVVRKNGGCTDTDDNASDFEFVGPAQAPRNSGSAVHLCATDAGADAATEAAADATLDAPAQDATLDAPAQDTGPGPDAMDDGGVIIPDDGATTVDATPADAADDAPLLVDAGDGGVIVPTDAGDGGVIVPTDAGDDGSVIVDASDDGATTSDASDDGGTTTSDAGDGGTAVTDAGADADAAVADAGSDGGGITDAGSDATVTDGGPDPNAGAGLVISQIFGGGGNTGAPLNRDYVEIFNRTNAPISLAGLSIQYGSDTGNFANPLADGGAGTGLTVLPNVTVPGGGYFLVAMGNTGTNGTALPAADLEGPSALSATNGKVALARITTTLACGSGTDASSNRCARANIVDMIGYGTATDYEGSAPTGNLSATKAALRNSFGCVDTDDNKADVSSGTPAPRNSKTALVNCAQLPDAGPTTDGGRPDSGTVTDAGRPDSSAPVDSGANKDSGASTTRPDSSDGEVPTEGDTSCSCKTAGGSRDDAGPRGAAALGAFAALGLAIAARRRRRG